MPALETVKYAGQGRAVVAELLMNLADSRRLPNVEVAQHVCLSLTYVELGVQRKPNGNCVGRTLEQRYRDKVLQGRAVGAAFRYAETAFCISSRISARCSRMRER